MTCEHRYCSSVKLLTGQILYFSDEETPPPPFFFFFWKQKLKKCAGKYPLPQGRYESQSLILAKVIHCLPYNDNVCNEIQILVTWHYLKLF